VCRVRIARGIISLAILLPKILASLSGASVNQATYDAIQVSLSLSAGLRGEDRVETRSESPRPRELHAIARALQGLARLLEAEPINVEVARERDSPFAAPRALNHGR
jgi:hypothetical protein